MARTISLLYDGVVDADYTVTDDSDNDFDFKTGPLAPARFQAGVEVSATILSEPSAPFTTEELTVTSNPLLLDQVVEGYPVEIQPTAYTGTPAAQVTRTFTLDGSDVLGDLSGANIYNVPAATAGQTLLYSEDASNNVVDGGNVLITRSTSVSDTVVVAAAPAFSSPPEINGDPQQGNIVTLVDGVATGAPTPTVTTLLELGGVDVTADIQSGIYEIPAGTTVGTNLVLTNTANSPEGTATDSVTVAVTESVLSVAQSLVAAGNGFVHTPDSIAYSDQAGTTVAVAGDFVRAWQDLGGADQTLLALSDSEAPILRESSGIKYLEADGSRRMRSPQSTAASGTMVLRTRANTATVSNNVGMMGYRNTPASQAYLGHTTQFDSGEVQINDERLGFVNFYAAPVEAHTYAVTWDAGSVSVYFDGALDESGTYTGTVPSGAIWVFDINGRTSSQALCDTWAALSLDYAATAQDMLDLHNEWSGYDL